MNEIAINRSPGVMEKFDTYPDGIRQKMEFLRKLILGEAASIPHIKSIEETLKWGEPSYIAKKGSTVRMDWKEKNPSQYAMYFSCSTSLVETFKKVYGNLFKYEKNRAIVFDIDSKIPENELKDCINMALQYHLLKDKPFLGR